jgi:hypothetical protein
MSALTDLTQTTGSSVTTLPGWYDQAQQNLVNQAGTALNQAPQLGQTTAQGAINTLQGPSNPFTQAQGSLNTIASGAANPWVTDASGNVTPNTSTAMGGLFAAQNAQLNQLMPNVTAPVEAGNIASGNFGSLRGQTAVDKAKADAFANLTAAQMQAALQNQQTGATAGLNLANVGKSGIDTAMSVGQAQMSAPFANAANYGNILAGINAPTNVSTTQTPSVLNQIGAAGSAISGIGTGADNLLKKLGVAGGLTGVGTSIADWFKGSAPIKINDTTGLELSSNQNPQPGDYAGLLQGADGKWYTDPTYGAGSAGSVPNTDDNVI